ncbi:hypothetical protein GJU40_19200 [Bacillus lacus]|uniref:Uncharacterized protein n=1 Tax=Metabacillus lacus TaxID=1983721 RepID=A0A7X2J2G6_9BACI|nr:hypothetical protein [Metabacillus lacus]MRX74251.1 hypothetical protein [Metabacillus lacus]
MSKILNRVKELSKSMYSSFKFYYKKYFSQDEVPGHSLAAAANRGETASNVFLKRIAGADQYDSLFHKPASAPNLFVQGELWNGIQENLPKHYTIPFQETVALLKPMESNSYDSLFHNSVSTPDLHVNNTLWRGISGKLPEQYILPNQHSLEIFSQLSGDQYSKKFIRNDKSSSGLFVNAQLWENITRALPINYSIPYRETSLLINAMSGDAYSHIFLNPSTKKTSAFVEPIIWNPIKEKLPVEYQVPRRESLQMLKLFNEEQYDHLFINPTKKGLQVDDLLWNTVLFSLPKEYKIPQISMAKLNGQIT